MHRWLYSDTNYILLGMIIRKVTGHSPITEIRPPDPGAAAPARHLIPAHQQADPPPYAHGYYGPIDVTNLVNPSVTWTAGAMISTVDDVARFYRALLTGRLLPRRNGASC